MDARCKYLLVAICLLITVPACADVADNATADANKLAAALVAGDYMTVAQLTHPKVVARVGGPPAVASSLRNAMVASQLTLHKMHFSQPRQIVRAGGTYIASIPFRSKATLRGEPVTINSFYIGFSQDGDRWHFIDCQGVSHVTIKQLVPAYNNSLNLSGC
jgi:hypothetical protein